MSAAKSVGVRDGMEELAFAGIEMQPNWAGEEGGGHPPTPGRQEGDVCVRHKMSWPRRRAISRPFWNGMPKANIDYD